MNCRFSIFDFRFNSNHPVCRTAPGDFQSAVGNRQSAIAFTLVELLVVIGIIALLLGILLPALGAARDRAKKLAATTQLQGLSAACDSYYTQFNAYPGYFSETAVVGFTTTSGTSAFSGTENMMVSLMGEANNSAASGTYITAASTGVKVVKSPAGPRTNYGGTNARLYGAFYSPKAGETADINNNDGDNDLTTGYKELVDPWSGMPVLYFRAVAGGTTPVNANGSPGIFYRDTAQDYLINGVKSSTGATYDNSSSGNSLLANTSNGDNNMAWFVINPDLSSGTGETADNPNQTTDVVKGAYVLWSAGKDGIYLNTTSDVTSKNISTRTMFNTYSSKNDDVVVTGGSR